MARDNYSFKKHQKEQARKKKSEEKRQNRLDKKNSQTSAFNAPSRDASVVPGAGADPARHLMAAPPSAPGPAERGSCGEASPPGHCRMPAALASNGKREGE